MSENNDPIQDEFEELCCKDFKLAERKIPIEILLHKDAIRNLEYIKAGIKNIKHTISFLVTEFSDGFDFNDCTYEHMPHLDNLMRIMDQADSEWKETVVAIFHSQIKHMNPPDMRKFFE